MIASDAVSAGEAALRACDGLAVASSVTVIAPGMEKGVTTAQQVMRNKLK